MTHECRSLPDAAQHLRALADEMDAMQQALLLPHESYTLEQAHNKLRACLGKEAYISIKMELSFHRAAKPGIEWTIYDGTKHYREQPSLAAAVNAVLADHVPTPHVADPVGAAQEALDGATESNIPF